MTAVYKSLPNDTYVIPKAQLLFQPQGQEEFFLLGDADEVTIEPTVEESERYSNEGGVKELALTVVTQVDATFNATLMQLSDINRALSLLGELEYATQGAIVGQTKNIIGVNPDEKMYELDGITDTTITAFTDGTTLVDYIEGVDYIHDAKAGIVQILSIPAGGDADVIITFDGAEILAASEVAKIGIANKTANRGKLIIRGTNEVGPRSKVVLHDVQLRPDGERNYISDEDFDSIEIVGRIFKDPSQPAGLQLGFEQDITE